jgi:lipid-binding SYLF domain-containing protein
VFLLGFSKKIILGGGKAKAKAKAKANAEGAEDAKVRRGARVFALYAAYGLGGFCI